MALIDKINHHILNPLVVDKRARLSHYPSEASVVSRADGKVIGKCLRALSYKWMGMQPSNPPDARAMWTFAMGTMIEKGYTEYIKQIGIWAGNNIHIYDPARNISGEIDILIKECDQLKGVEIKTAYGYGFQNNVLKFPKLENLLQVGIYLDYFKDIIKEWLIIYKARDTQEEVEYSITMDKDDTGHFLVVNHTTPVKMFYVEDIYKRFEELGSYLSKNELAPRDFTYCYSPEDSKKRFEAGEITKSRYSKIEKGTITDSDWNCVYCDHLDTCWAEKRKALKMKGVTIENDSE